MAVEDQEQISNVRLFLASPGGVDDERGAVRRVALELSLALRRSGWQVEVLGWEDRGPATGRAQEDINVDVERCDIFLGVMWDRWGTPTGEHSSGFAEEWHLAKSRWEATGKPDLWLCFKDVDPTRSAAPDEQLAQVLAFKSNVQHDEIVFYKAFRSPADLEVSVRRELLNSVLQRAGLSRERVGTLTVDWNATLAHEPVALVQGGPERERLAGELANSDPPRAAAMFLELAGDVEELGFANVGERLRDRAAQVLDAAGHHDEALGMWRRLLIRAVESGHPLDAASAAQQLRTRVSPEHHWEALAWSACVEWPDRPEDAARHLARALERTPANDANREVRRLWRRTLWEVQILTNLAAAVVQDGRRLSVEAPGEYDDDLLLLRAEALCASADSSADNAWQSLRSRALDVAESQPARAARLTARWGVHLARRHDWAAAEEAFVRAATLWGRVPGLEQESAACFFSAQTAAQLGGEWIPRGWSWRSLAASLPGDRDTFASRARIREQSGLAAHANRSFDDARRHLALALVIHARGGHLGGMRRVTGMLGNAARDAGDALDAALRYCDAGNGKEAAKAARDAPARELIERLPVGQTEWQTRAACAVLGVVGRHASERRAAELLPHVLELSVRASGANLAREPEAAEALRELVIAASDHDAANAMARLVELLHSDDYVLSGTAARGMAMLTEIGRLDGADWLVSRFAGSRWADEVSPSWVAEHLDTPERVSVVRTAAVAGNVRAMQALGLAHLIAGDVEAEDSCSRYVEARAASDHGYTEDGSSIHGLLALDAIVERRSNWAWDGGSVPFVVVMRVAVVAGLARS